MTWRQVYDGKDWQAEIAQVYDVQSIPFTILLGKDGKVAGTNLRGAKLEEAVVNDQEPSKEIAVAMCTADEPGEKLQVYGRVLDEHGKPLQKASVIAYSTDMTGLYVPRGSRSRTPRISAVAVTNDG